MLFTPGEVAADGYTGYLTEQALPGLLARATKGAVVLIERELIADNDSMKRA